MPRTKNGAVDWDRTSDLLVTNELLCQLSYNGIESLYHNPLAILIKILYTMKGKGS